MKDFTPLADNIGPAVKRVMVNYPNLKGDAVIPHGIEENVWQSIEDLFIKSPATRNLVNGKSAKVVGAIYDVGSGKIKWLPISKVDAILKKVEASPNLAKNPMTL